MAALAPVQLMIKPREVEARTEYRGDRSDMKNSNFAVRLQPSLLEEARKLAADEGVALSQLINVAVAEKLLALRTERYCAERADRADPRRARAILKRAGIGNSPRKGDALPRKRK